MTHGTGESQPGRQRGAGGEAQRPCSPAHTATSSKRSSPRPPVCVGGQPQGLRRQGRGLHDGSAFHPPPAGIQPVVERAGVARQDDHPPQGVQGLRQALVPGVVQLRHVPRRAPARPPQGVDVGGVDVEQRGGRVEASEHVEGVPALELHQLEAGGDAGEVLVLAPGVHHGAGAPHLALVPPAHLPPGGRPVPGLPGLDVEAPRPLKVIQPALRVVCLGGAGEAALLPGVGGERDGPAQLVGALPQHPEEGDHQAVGVVVDLDPRRGLVQQHRGGPAEGLRVADVGREVGHDPGCDCVLAAVVAQGGAGGGGRVAHDATSAAYVSGSSTSRCR